MEKSTLQKIKSILIIILILLFSAAIIIFSNKISQLQTLGYFGIFLIMLLGNATVLIPVPVLAPLNILFGGTLASPLLVGLAAGTGSSLGELSGYLLGYSGSTFLKSSKPYIWIQHKFNDWGLFLIFLLALIPNPFFDIGGLIAGASNIKWWKFLLVTLLGKTIRSIALAYIGYGGKILVF